MRGSNLTTGRPGTSLSGKAGEGRVRALLAAILWRDGIQASWRQAFTVMGPPGFQAAIAKVQAQKSASVRARG